MSATHRLHTIQQHIDLKLLAGKVALITGSGQGIGAAAAKLFAFHGASVVVTDVDEAKANAVVQEILTAGGSAVAFNGDIMELSFPDRLIEFTIKQFGKLNYLINNAGFTWDGMIHKVTDKQWEAILTIHQTVPFRLIRASTPYMRDAGKAEKAKGSQPEDRCIINISSVNGIHGKTGQVNYSTAKAGLVGMTKTVCREWGPFGVRCNVVAFGIIDTRLVHSKAAGEFIVVDGQKVILGLPDVSSSKLPPNAEPMYPYVPLGRMGTVEEAAGSLLLLCSPYASFISGQCLEVAGGGYL